MCAIAKRDAAGMFAAAPRDGPGSGDFHPVRCKASTLVRAVAERLALGEAANAPPILTGLNFQNERGTLGYDGVFHAFFLTV